jgi:hypothetical protein
LGRLKCADPITTGKEGKVSYDVRSSGTVRYSSSSRHPLVASLIAGLLFIAIMFAFAPRHRQLREIFAQK